MRKFLTNTAGALTALMIGSTAMVALPTISAAQNIQLAQRDERRGGGGDRDRDRGGQRAERGDRGDRGGQRSERGDRGDRGGQRTQRGGDRTDRGDFMRRREARPDTRRELRREFRRDRRDDRRERRWDRRDHRWDRRARAPFVFLGGPRIVVREYGPGWCRGLHRGYHWAPRVGWHTGTHRGLYRCR